MARAALIRVPAQEDATMAADGEATKEMRAHEGSYARFLFMMKWGTILSLIIGFLVILIISN
jgi:hypothetical protein